MSPQAHKQRGFFDESQSRNEQRTEDNEDKRINEERNISTGFADWISSDSTKAQTRKGSGITCALAHPLQGIDYRSDIILLLSAIVQDRYNKVFQDLCERLM